MEVHQIDVISVQSLHYDGKVVTDACSVHGIYSIEDVVRVVFCCII